MTRHANRVHTDPAEIARIQGLIAELVEATRLELELEDGRRVSGIVAARPMAQVFFDAEGREGTNAVVRIDEPALEHPGRAGWTDVWVDEIVHIRRPNPTDTRGGPQLQR